MSNPKPTDGTANLVDFQEGSDQRRHLKGRKPRYEIAKLIEERGALAVADDAEGRTKAEKAIDRLWDIVTNIEGKNTDAIKAFAELSKYGWGTPEVKDNRQVMLMIVAGAQQRGINPRDDPILGAIFSATGYRPPAIASPRSTGGDSADEVSADRQDEGGIVDA
jgi:hypothetical protein